MVLTIHIREIGFRMSQHEYTVGLATPRTPEEILALAKEYMEKKRLAEMHPPTQFRDTSNGE
jgi:hypothetical protein